MNILQKLINKTYFRVYDIFWHKKVKLLPPSLQSSKNLFLYFDYEREFGNEMARVTDNDINKILELLDKYQFKTTFFTVGKIFEAYPESIKIIIDKGHEVGSHTFDHIKQTNVSKNNVSKDFNDFKKISTAVLEVRGFHSPNGEWNHQTVKNLSKFNYGYDVISKKKRKDVNYIRVRYTKNKLFRFLTFGDDYPLYKKNGDSETVKQHFIKLYRRLNNGQLGGIGFHPWVLFSNENIWHGFKEFIEFLSTEKNLNIDTAIKFVSEIKESFTENHKENSTLKQ
ncbi:MAG: polysaccharide deacetylase family protein [Thiohalospira sp.]